MQIKPQAVNQHIQKKRLPLYVLIGQDTYLLEEAFNTIKAHIKTTNDCDEQIINIQTTDDWKTLEETSNCYSLFASNTLINAVLDKKTIDANGKKILTKYLDQNPSNCFTILRAPNLPAKQIQWLTNHPQVLVVVAYPLNTAAMKQWITNQLSNKTFKYNKEVPELILHYTQGNMLACAQVIEKISLTNPANSQISSQHVLDHVSNQCDHSLYELVDACLLGHADKAIQVLRQAANNKTEATLVLWMLTQEVRILSQILFAQQQNTDLKTINPQLKIWPQRSSLYQQASKRLTAETLKQLLAHSKIIDEQIKSTLNKYVWNALECLAVSICVGRIIGDACTV